MSTKEQESNLHERVAKLETANEAVIRGLADIKEEIRSLSSEVKEEIRILSTRMDARFQASEARMDVRFEALEARMSTGFNSVNLRLDSWLKWVLGFIFSSWLTLMISFWLKR